MFRSAHSIGIWRNSKALKSFDRAQSAIAEVNF